MTSFRCRCGADRGLLADRQGKLLPNVQSLDSRELREEDRKPKRIRQLYISLSPQCVTSRLVCHLQFLIEALGLKLAACQSPAFETGHHQLWQISCFHPASAASLRCGKQLMWASTSLTSQRPEPSSPMWHLSSTSVAQHSVFNAHAPLGVCVGGVPCGRREEGGRRWS